MKELLQAVAETQTALAKIYLRGFPLSAARDFRVGTGTREGDIGNGTKATTVGGGAGGAGDPHTHPHTQERHTTLLPGD